MTQELTPPLGWQGIETAALEDIVLNACRQYADMARAYTGTRRDVHTRYIVADAVAALRALPPPPTEQADEGCSSRKGEGK